GLPLPAPPRQTQRTEAGGESIQRGLDSRVTVTLAVLQVTVVRNTATAAPPWKSIVSPAFAPIQPNVIPVTAETSRNNTSFDPVARGERYWLGGVATSTPPGALFVLRAQICTRKSSVLLMCTMVSLSPKSK